LAGILCSTAAALPAAAQSGGAGTGRVPWLVATGWVQDHLGDAELIVLQVAVTRREYRQGHVRGALFVWVQSYAPSTPDGSYDLPTTEQAASLFRELGLRPGHIPGAVNVPFGSLLDGSRIKDEAALREVFKPAGVEPAAEVVSCCHIGQQASLVWLAARILGHEARLYDGSFEDWSGRDDLPVVKPSAVAEPP
jgi:3-mercaptopyruvate sulfurtransferase SseA